MTYDDAVQYVLGLVDYEKTPMQAAMAFAVKLDRMQELLRRAGNPERGLRCVHLAGTKGKGSTAAMVARMLRVAGRRTGLFTKPHLVTFRERMRIDDELISEEEFAALVAEIQPLIESMRGGADGTPTFFEAITLAAFLWFKRQGAEITVLETGLGGRLDSTNVVQPVATAITTIDFDHITELGDTLEQIAWEKAGIIKPGVPVVSAPQAPEAAEVIARVAAERGSPLYRVGEEIMLQPGARNSLEGQYFSVTGRLNSYQDLFIPLIGAHQQTNAAVAMGLAECLQEAGEPVTPEAIRTGLAAVEWPGRLQILQRDPLLLLDGAHDPIAVEALLAALGQYFPGQRRLFVLGFSCDKDWQTMLRQLAPAAEEFIFTSFGGPRAVPPETLAAEVGKQNAPVTTTAPNTEAAIQTALQRAHPNDLICVTGSLYIVGEALRWWQQK